MHHPSHAPFPAWTLTRAHPAQLSLLSTSVLIVNVFGEQPRKTVRDNTAVGKAEEMANQTSTAVGGGRRDKGTGTRKLDWPWFSRLLNDLLPKAFAWSCRSQQAKRNFTDWIWKSMLDMDGVGPASLRALRCLPRLARCLVTWLAPLDSFPEPTLPTAATGDVLLQLPCQLGVSRPSIRELCWLIARSLSFPILPGVSPHPETSLTSSSNHGGRKECVYSACLNWIYPSHRVC